MVKKDHYDQIDNSNNQYAKLKKFRICNHAIAPFLFTRGAHSPRNEGKPPAVLMHVLLFVWSYYIIFSFFTQRNSQPFQKTYQL